MRWMLPWQMLHNMQENWIRSTSGCIKFGCYNIKYLYLYPFAMLLEVDTPIHKHWCMITVRDAMLFVFIQYKTLNIEQTIFHKPEKWLKLCVFFLVHMDVYWWLQRRQKQNATIPTACIGEFRLDQLVSNTIPIYFQRFECVHSCGVDTQKRYGFNFSTYSLLRVRSRVE